MGKGQLVIFLSVNWHHIPMLLLGTDRARSDAFPPFSCYSVSDQRLADAVPGGSVVIRPLKWG